MATCRLHGERKGPSDWSQAAGKPASVGRAVCSINAWRFFATTPSRDTTHLRGIPAARDQSAGSPHTPHTLYFALPPEGSLGGVPRGFCLPPDLVAPFAVPAKGPKRGRVSHSTHHPFRARTPDLMDVPSLYVRLVR